MNNTAIKLNLEDEKQEKTIIPYGKTKLTEWIKYDSRDVSEKAIIMFLDGKKHESICRFLNITPSYFGKLVFNYYESRLNRNNLTPKETQKLKSPTNFSEWNSSIIYNHLNHLRQKNQKIKLKL